MDSTPRVATPGYDGAALASPGYTMSDGASMPPPPGSAGPAAGDGAATAYSPSPASGVSHTPAASPSPAGKPATPPTAASNYTNDSMAGMGSAGMGSFGNTMNMSSTGLDKGHAALAAQQQAREAALQAAEITSLRSELKRLRDDNAQLRKVADKFRELEREADMLRGASLMQHEEKVPIRLRQLEQENLRLRKLNTGLEARVRRLESDEWQRHQQFFDNDFLSVATAEAASPSTKGRGKAGSPGGGGGAPNDVDELLSGVGTDGSAASPGRPSVHVGQKSVVVIKGGTGPCTSCRFRLDVQQRAHEGEKLRLKETVKELETRLGAATKELDAIQQWVAHVVQTHQTYPTLAQRFPSTSLMSPQQAPMAPEYAGASPGYGAATPNGRQTTYLDAQRSSRRGQSEMQQSAQSPLPPGTPPRARAW